MKTIVDYYQCWQHFFGSPMLDSQHCAGTLLLQYKTTMCLINTEDEKVISTIIYKGWLTEWPKAGNYLSQYALCQPHYASHLYMLIDVCDV